MKENANIAGVFGKMPCLGDFVTRRLTSDFVEVWDPWLQGALLVSREQLGASWLNRYLTSPIWRFLLSPGICGDQAWTGILTPSVDRVGRYFPLTFAVALDPSYSLHELFAASEQWYARMEQLALAVLEEVLDVDGLDRQLQSDPFPAEHDAAKMNDLREPAINADAFYFRVPQTHPQPITAALARIGIHFLSDRHPTYSLWSAKALEAEDAQVVRAYRHLPRRREFQKLLVAFDAACPAKSDSRAATMQIIDERIQMPERSCGIDPRINPPIQWSSFVLTTAGQCRETNEDAYLNRPEIGLWVVADGMGGHSHGGQASKSVVDSLAQLAATGNLESFCSYTKECLKRVNRNLLDTAHRHAPGSIMGSTVVVLLAVGRNCAVLWAGDSRLYLLRDGALSQLTRDHSLAEELSQQEVRAEDNGIQNTEHIVTRALGADPELVLEVATFQAKPGDAYLLCSDGLIREVTDTEIEAIMKTAVHHECAQRLVDMAMQRGARDNVTTVVAYAEGPDFENCPTINTSSDEVTP